MSHATLIHLPSLTTTSNNKEPLSSPLHLTFVSCQCLHLSSETRGAEEHGSSNSSSHPWRTSGGRAACSAFSQRVEALGRDGRIALRNLRCGCDERSCSGWDVRGVGNLALIGSTFKLHNRILVRWVRSESAVWVEHRVNDVHYSVGNQDISCDDTSGIDEDCSVDDLQEVLANNSRMHAISLVPVFKLSA